LFVPGKLLDSLIFAYGWPGPTQPTFQASGRLGLALKSLLGATNSISDEEKKFYNNIYPNVLDATKRFGWN
jgi:hypothetical protein